MKGKEMEVQVQKEDLPPDGDIHYYWKISGGRAFFDLTLFLEIRPQMVKRYTLRLLITGVN